MKAKIKLKNYKFNTIKISGSKNSSLPIIAASILCDEQVTINNVPNIHDVNALITLLKKIGYDISFNNNTVIVNPKKINIAFFFFIITRVFCAKIQNMCFLLNIFLYNFRHIAQN